MLGLRLFDVGKYIHLVGGVEGAVDLALATARLFHPPIALGLLDGILDEALNTRITQFVGIRCVWPGLRVTLLTLKGRLEITPKMLVDCLFGVGLHVQVDRRVDAQSIGV